MAALLSKVSELFEDRTNVVEFELDFYFSILKCAPQNMAALHKRRKHTRNIRKFRQKNEYYSSCNFHINLHAQLAADVSCIVFIFSFVHVFFSNIFFTAKKTASNASTLKLSPFFYSLFAPISISTPTSVIICFTRILRIEMHIYIVV